MPKKLQSQGKPRGRPRKARQILPEKVSRRRRKTPKARPRDNEALLPPIAGPKLHRFVDSDAEVKFVQLLTDPESDPNTHVFEVTIATKTYALKIVRLPRSSIHPQAKHSVSTV